MVFDVVKIIQYMIDIEKTLVKIVLALVAILFVVLLFSSCKSKNTQFNCAFSILMASTNTGEAMESGHLNNTQPSPNLN